MPICAFCLFCKEGQERKKPKRQWYITFRRVEDIQVWPDVLIRFGLKYEEPFGKLKQKRALKARKL